MPWFTHPELRWYRTEIETAAHVTGVDVAIVTGIVLTESGGLTHLYRPTPKFWQRSQLATQPFYRDQHPRRWAASYGLMQIPATTARELGHTGIPEDLFQPACGLRFGCLHLRRCLEWATSFQSGDKDTLISALAAYHGGRSSAQRPPNPLNAPYALQVLKHAEAA